MPGRGSLLVPEGWRVVPLRDVLVLDQPGAWGDDPTSDDPGVRVLRAADLTRDGQVEPSGAAWRRLSERDRKRRLMKEGDLILERSGGGPGTPVGRVALIDGFGPVYCNNFCQQLRVDGTRCSPYYAVRALWHRYTLGLTARLEHRTTGIRNLDYEGYLNLPLLLPPLPEQRAIAAMLDSIDEAIERTDEVIAATERLRDALLHELLTRGLPGHHKDWRDVPGLGTIPASWEVVHLGDVGHWLSGGTPSKTREDYWSGDIPWISPKDMKTRQIRDVEDHISEEGARVGSRLVPAGTIFVVVRGMILAHSFPLAVSRVVAAFNQDIRALVCKDGAVPEFVVAALEHQKPRLLHLPTPSTHGTMRVVSEELFAIPVPLPPLPEQQAIAAALGSVDAAIERAREERAALQSSKASTADALLTGRVRVGRSGK